MRAAARAVSSIVAVPVNAALAETTAAATSPPFAPYAVSKVVFQVPSVVLIVAPALPATA